MRQRCSTSSPWKITRRRRTQTGVPPPCAASGKTRWQPCTCLEQLEGELAHLSTRNFSEHSAINAILQNAAYRAEEMGVDFHAQALVPGDLELDEGDLCALLLNMLDNALEAASKVEPPREREVRCRVKLTQGFLAVWCQNTYTGPLRLDGGGIVSISHDGSRFTVETALKLP